MSTIKYRQTPNDEWKEILVIQGEQGIQGPQGEQGPPGETVDLTGYATETYVDEAIANIDIPEAEINLPSTFKGINDNTSIEFTLGTNNKCTQEGSLIIGNYNTLKNFINAYGGHSARYCFVVGQENTMEEYAENSVAIGKGNSVNGDFTYAIGKGNTVVSMSTREEGSGAIGRGNRTSGADNLVLGFNNVSDEYQVVIGTGTPKVAKDKARFVVGIGDPMWNSTKTGMTISPEGKAWFLSDVYVGGTSVDDGSKLATEAYVQEAIAAALAAKEE